MKVFKFLAMLMAAFTLSFTATSCGDDVEDIGGGGDNKMSAKLTKSDNQLVLTISYPGYKSTQTAKFSNNLCTSYVFVLKYSSSKLAEIAWEAAKAEMDEEDKIKYSRNGDTITMDATEEFKGMTYEIILAQMEEQKAAIERAAQ